MWNSCCAALRASLACLLALLVWAAPARAQGIFSADSRIAVTTIVVSSVVAPVIISTSPSTLYAIEGATTSTVSPTWVKMYNGVPAACGVGTPFARYPGIPRTVAAGSKQRRRVWRRHLSMHCWRHFRFGYEQPACERRHGQLALEAAAVMRLWLARSRLSLRRLLIQFLGVLPR
jgi:hypothetical protein